MWWKINKIKRTKIEPISMIAKTRMIANRWDILYNQKGELIKTKSDLAKLLYWIWRRHG